MAEGLRKKAETEILAKEDAIRKLDELLSLYRWSRDESNGRLLRFRTTSRIPKGKPQSPQDNATVTEQKLSLLQRTSELGASYKFLGHRIVVSEIDGHDDHGAPGYRTTHEYSHTTGLLEVRQVGQVEPYLAEPDLYPNAGIEAKSEEEKWLYLGTLADQLLLRRY